MAYILGLSGGFCHDAAACLVHSGNILAFAEEERFTRRKHNNDSRNSSRAIAYCLAEANIRLEDVAEIAISWNPHWPQSAEYTEDVDVIDEIFDVRYFNGYKPKRLKIINHHLAHAASAFYCSGFQDASILVVDGAGDGVSTSLLHGTRHGIQEIETYDFTQSLGWFYDAITSYVGLGNWQNAGKLMGLASYGQPIYTFDVIQPVTGGYNIDLPRYGLVVNEDLVSDYKDLMVFPQIMRAYRNSFEKANIPFQTPILDIEPQYARLINRTSYGPLQQNLAASAQQTLEQCLVALAEGVIQKTRSGKLCIAGGVGLNASANGKLRLHPLIEDLYVQPIAGDAGGAIGAALETSRQVGGFHFPLSPLKTTSLGPQFSNKQIYHALKNSGLPFAYHTDIEQVTAKALITGTVVGWFQGRMEGGPRALGNRSILADPRSTKIRDHINAEVKHREMWRPLAPSIRDTHLSQYILNPGPAEFMVFAYQATERALEEIDGTIHVDGSMRPQSVAFDTNIRFARLLDILKHETGIPVVLNTSFNQADEPIVCTPHDAIRTFCSTQLDALSIGNFFVQKLRHDEQVDIFDEVQN